MILCHETEKPVLEGLYRDFAVPTDQLRRCPEALRTIVGTFNRLTGRDFDAELLLRYMFNRRKEKDWPRLERDARRFESPAKEFSPAELEALKSIYVNLDETADDLQFSPGLLRTISRRFRQETGKSVPGSVLVTVILAKRKRGEWPAIQSAFADVEEASNI